MLKEGDKVPRFELQSDAGEKLGPGKFPGKHLVVYFYPKDNTPGCTRQAQAFAASAKALTAAGAVVLGISKDSITSHCNFRDKYKLNFPLLSDPDLTVHKAFGAYGEKTMYGKKVLGTIRSTFIVDPKGKVAKVFPAVKVDGHADAVLSALSELAGPGGKAATKKGPVATHAKAKKLAAPPTPPPQKSSKSSKKEVAHEPGQSKAKAKAKANASPPSASPKKPSPVAAKSRKR